jgi:hypothetical protein
MQAAPFKKYKKTLFLLDVFKLALTAFGGPQVHFTMFKKNLVVKKAYISEQDLAEMNSFCSMLPGPTSYCCGLQIRRTIICVFNPVSLDISCYPLYGNFGHSSHTNAIR